MPAPSGAPEWAKQICVAFESGASGQFVLHGNVQDRLPLDCQSLQRSTITSRCNRTFSHSRS